MGVTIRLVERSDSEALREIYNREVRDSTVTFDMVERTPEEQLAWIGERRGAYAAIVAVDEVPGAVVGFGSLSPYRPRAAYSPTVEDSVYVHREHRGRGHGRRLLEELVIRARDHGFHTVIARIVGGHEASIALHEACGFGHAGTEREVGRKFNRWLDVVVRQRML
jgi:L-amino acid N-acyltransferase YncA